MQNCTRAGGVSRVVETVPEVATAVATVPARPENPNRWRLPAGLTEDELFAAYGVEAVRS